MPEQKNLRDSPWRALSAFMAALILAFILPLGIHAATLQASWNPNTELDLKGYKIYYGTAPGDYSESIDVGNVTGYELTGLTDGTRYYLALTAYDTSLNESPFSAEVSITPNRPPHSPGTPSPFDGNPETVLAPVLTWMGGDPDPEDTVTYDIYLGTGNPLPPVSKGQSDTMLSPGTLPPSTTFFWQVVSRDNHGMETRGTVWRFTTLESTRLFPTASLLLNQTSLRKGDLLSLDIRLTTPTAVPPGGFYSFELKLWLRMPLDFPRDWISLLDVAGPGNQITLPPGFDQTIPFIQDMPVPSDLPAGLYELGIRLRDTITNEELSVDTQPFSVIEP